VKLAVLLTFLSLLSCRAGMRRKTGQEVEGGDKVALSDSGGERSAKVDPKEPTLSPGARARPPTGLGNLDVSKPPSAGSGRGVIGLAKLGTIGQGPDRGKGYCIGPGGKRSTSRNDRKTRSKASIERGRKLRQRVRLKFGRFSVIGKYNAEVVRRIVRLQVGQLQRCFTLPLPDARIIISYPLELSFAIDLNGLPENVTTRQVKSSTAYLSLVNRCISTVISKLDFPRPRSGDTVDVSVRMHGRLLESKVAY